MGRRPERLRASVRRQLLRHLRQQPRVPHQQQTQGVRQRRLRGLQAALLDPLAAVGISTITLDNTGHNDKTRGRGTSSKDDLTDIAYVLEATKPFSLTRQGRIELKVTHSRLGELSTGDTFILDIGGGHYGTWQRAGEDEHRRLFHAECVQTLHTKPLGAKKLFAEVRANGISGDKTRWRDWLKQFVEDDASPIDHDETAGYHLRTGGCEVPHTPTHPPLVEAVHQGGVA